MKTGVIYCPNHWGLKSGKKKYSEIVSLLDDVLTDYDFVQSESVDSVERIAGMMINISINSLYKESINYNIAKKVTRVPQCPPDKENAITDALRHYKMI